MRILIPVFLAAALIAFSSGCGQTADVTSPKGDGPERTGHQPGGYASTTSSTTGMGAPSGR